MRKPNITMRQVTLRVAILGKSSFLCILLGADIVYNILKPSGDKEVFCMNLKNIRNTMIGSAAISIVLGLIMLFFPQITSIAVCLVKIVEYFSKIDLGYMFRFDLIMGIVQLVVGILLLCHPGAIMVAIPVVLGISLLIASVLKAQLAIDIKRMGYGKWWVSMLGAVLGVVLAIMIMSNPFEGTTAVFMVIGISYVVDGLLDLYTILRVSKAVSEFRKNFQY